LTLSMVGLKTSSCHLASNRCRREFTRQGVGSTVKECIVFDCSTNLLRAVGVRDEIREITSAVYLGKVYIAGMRVPDFLLEREEPPGA